MAKNKFKEKVREKANQFTGKMLNKIENSSNEDGFYLLSLNSYKSFIITCP